MSRIFGIISQDKGPIETAWLQQMGQTMQHFRHEQPRVHQLDGVALGHVQLKLAPEADYEQQPFVYKHWIITADARLDAREELLRKLAVPASLWPSLPDDQLIVRAYERWGAACVNHLLGDFAFAIWDTKDRQLFCAKDHAGVNPFLYYVDSRYFIFASELRSMVTLPMVPQVLNEDKLRAYLLLHFNGEEQEQTFFKGINRLMPAHRMTLSGRELSRELYWRAEHRTTLKLGSDADYAEGLRHLMQEATRDRLRTAYGAGIQLSGGLDSSMLACLAARELAAGGKSLYGFSSVLPEDHDGVEEDERAYIELLKRQETNLCITYVSARDKAIFADLDTIFRRTYSPFNCFYYLDWALAEATARTGDIRVVLSGYAGDGTVSQFGQNALGHLGIRLQWRKLWAILHERKQVWNNSYWRLVKTHLLRPLKAGWLENYSAAYLAQKIDSLLQQTAVNENFARQIDLAARYRAIAKRDYHPFNIYKSTWNENLLWFPEEESLPEAFHGFKIVYPLVDKRILDFLLMVPPEQFIQHGWWRGLMRGAMEGVVPKEIQWRADKTMFSPDYSRRLGEMTPALREQCEAVQNDQTFRRFVDVGKILEELDKVNIPANWGELNNNLITRVGVGVIGIAFLKFIRELGARFESF